MGYVGSVRHISTESGIEESSSNSRLVCCIHFHTTKGDHLPLKKVKSRGPRKGQ